jgi:signal peptidase II
LKRLAQNSKLLTHNLVWLAVAVTVLVLDQATKAWITSSMVSHDVRVIIEGFLRLRYTENTGAAFGLFQGWTGALSIVAVAIISILVLSASRIGSGSRVLLLALGLVLGGATGNLTDRIRLGYVVDFIEVYGPHVDLNGTIYTFPVFNVADSAITVGVLLIIATMLFGNQESHARPRPADPQPPPEPGSSPRFARNDEC